MDKWDYMHRGFIKLLVSLIMAVSAFAVAQAQELLNPMPSEIVQGRKKPLDIRKGFVVTDVQSAFTDDFGFLLQTEGGVTVKIDYGEKVSQKKHVPQIPGSYSLVIAGKGITITGYDEIGAYNGIVTLRQLMKDSDGSLRCMEIKDTPSIPFRGIMETFPCSPRQHVERLIRLDDYALSKFNMYFYAPSDDIIRSSEGWKYPYDPADMDRLKEVISACEKNRMEFIWTIAPGETYHDTEDDYKFLLNKLVLMYYSGIRSFALIKGGAEFRPDIADRLQRDFVDVRRERPAMYIYDSLAVKTIDVTAGDSTTLSLGPEFFDSFNADVERFVVRLDEDSPLSKFKVFSTVDWMWNPDRYQADNSWERSISRYVPEVRDAFTKFAIYTDATGSTDKMKVNTFTVSGYNVEKSSVLMREFKYLSELPDTLQKCRDKALLKVLNPWIVQMGNLGRRGVITLECMSYFMASDQIAFLKSYVGTTVSEDERQAADAHKVGSRLLTPFCDRVSRELASRFYKDMNDAVVIHNPDAVDSHPFYRAMDGNLATFMNCHDRTSFNVPAGASRCHVLFGEKKGMVLFRQLSKEGGLIAELLVKNPYVEMEIKPGTVAVDVLGDIELFETIFVK